MKKILIPGGTGAMGTYLVPELRSRGYAVDVVSLDDVKSSDPHLRYFNANFKETSVAESFIKQGYDAIIDFMVYGTEAFRARMDMLLSNTEHYIGFSSYRVYANEELPITERSPRLLDVSKDAEFIKEENEYSLYKARIEDIVKGSKYMNWTFFRPSITFSKFRYQLVTLEANVVIAAAKNKVPVLLPREALDKQTTMTWAGDVAKMIAELLFKKEAMREIYHPATSEHHTWREIAEYYRELIGLEAVPCDNETYLRAISGGDMINPTLRRQLELDRLFDRVMDNSKILSATGMKQSELTPMRDALARELSELPEDAFSELSDINRLMLDYINKR